ncbi:ABC transporter substrate-binding protein [Paraconexibacter algicola]|uniref:ABC transporter substrate-binding protein n=1 Tax=Paraconexibacter algicola TaxID=2133960 RepID=A0A2T4UI36_9ACTN|nr:ABC transporter substrate-binding protein [Paraconexibacter algicola]PTL58914.1 ABC transporter substrate-binding protein [Paraconexibacter algicola]
MTAPRLLSLLAAIAAALILAACGDDPPAPSTAASAGGFAEVQRQARGQTVRWWLFGGDEGVNRYVDDVVAPAARRLGVSLRRVPVADTADAVQRVVSERRAGRRTGGAVDLIWINGENFASGKRAGLWLEDWATRLPNARLLDPDDPSLREDFRVPVDGQESPWQRAAFVFAHDRARTPRPPRSFDELLAFARANPGRVTYPAPPDFTGSAFVRQVVAAKGADAAMRYLHELAPLLYRGGRSYPKSEAELTRLFGDGEIDLAMSYDAAFVRAAVRRGIVPRSARPFVLGDGTLQNVSFVAIPANAANAAGAQVVANLLLDPRLQAAKADPAGLGNPTVLQLDRLDPAQRSAFTRAARSPYLLDDLGEALPELAADEVAPLEQRWTREVLRGAGT